MDNGAIPLVEQFGFSEKAVGMTVVAIGTSLPELFVTLMALSKKRGWYIFRKYYWIKYI